MAAGISSTKFFETFLALSQQKGLSVSVAAEEAGLGRSAVTNWRRGHLPGEKALSKLTAYFGVTREYLLNGLPDEPETGSKIEFYDNMQKAPFPGLNEGAKERSQLISRDFAKFVLGLLKIYCPDETTESLADKLKMSKKMLNNEHFRNVSIDMNWGGRFYSLLEDTGVSEILHHLYFAGQILNAERKKAYYSSLTRIILEYMSEDGLVPEFVREGTSHDFLLFSSYWAIVKSKASKKCWLFCFYDVSALQNERHMHHLCKDDQWTAEFPDVERFIMMYTYNPNQATDCELAELKKVLFRLCPDVIARLNIQTWLLPIDIAKGEAISSEQVIPGEWANSQFKGCSID